MNVNAELKKLLDDQRSFPHPRGNLAYLLSFTMREVTDIMTYVTRIGIEERIEE